MNYCVLFSLGPDFRKKSEIKQQFRTYCRYDELSGEQTDSWDSAVGDQRDRCEGVDDGVGVCKPL